MITCNVSLPLHQNRMTSARSSKGGAAREEPARGRTLEAGGLEVAGVEDQEQVVSLPGWEVDADGSFLQRQWTRQRPCYRLCASFFKLSLGGHLVFKLVWPVNVGILALRLGSTQITGGVALTKDSYGQRGRGLVPPLYNDLRAGFPGLRDPGAGKLIFRYPASLITNGDFLQPATHGGSL